MPFLHAAFSRKYTPLITVQTIHCGVVEHKGLLLPAPAAHSALSNHRTRGEEEEGLVCVGGVGGGEEGERGKVTVQLTSTCDDPLKRKSDD